MRALATPMSSGECGLKECGGIGFEPYLQLQKRDGTVKITDYNWNRVPGLPPLCRDHRDPDMDATIDGGVPPRGRARGSGAKNSATRLLAAALLTDQICELGNFPTRLVDVGHKARFIQAIGGDVKLDHEHSTATIDPHGIQSRLLADFGDLVSKRKTAP